jgi:hypothetical protein
MSEDFISPLAPGEILDKLKTVDGLGSGLDADALGGRQFAQERPRMIFRPMFYRPTYGAIMAAYISRY